MTIVVENLEIVHPSDHLGMHCFGYDLASNFKDEFTVRVHDQEPGKFNSYGEGDYR